MKKRMNYFFRFTLVNRFTCELVRDVYCMGYDVPSATRHLRRLFSAGLYDVSDVMMVSNPSLVVVGYSNLEDLL